MVRRIRHMVIAFVTGALFGHFAIYAFLTWKGRAGAVGGEILFIPLMVLLVVMGWQARGEVEWTKK